MKKTILSALLCIGLSSPAMAYSSQAEDLMVFLNRHLYGTQIPQSIPSPANPALFTPSAENPYGLGKGEDVILGYLKQNQLIQQQNTPDNPIYGVNRKIPFGAPLAANAFAPPPISLFAKPKKGKILLSKNPPRF